MRESILRSKLRPTGTSHRRTSALPNIRRRNAARGIATGQISGLRALLPHLLAHLHEPRNAVLNRRMRGKQAREALRGERTGDHHRSHRLRAGGLLHRHRGCAAGNLAQRGSERFRILRQLGTVFVASYSRVREIAICISDAAIGARIVLSSTPSNPKPPDAESSRSSRERPPPKYMSE